MRTLAAIAVLFLVAACQAPPPEMTDAEIAQIEAETTRAISDRWTAFWETTQAGDFDGWADFWTSDIRMLQPGVDVSGSAWFDFGRDFFASGMEFLTLDIEPFDVFVHGDVAYQVGRFDETATLASGEPVEWHEYFFVRWERGTDGVWRMDRFLSTPREAPAEG